MTDQNDVQIWHRSIPQCRFELWPIMEWYRDRPAPPERIQVHGFSLADGRDTHQGSPAVFLWGGPLHWDDYAIFDGASTALVMVVQAPREHLEACREAVLDALLTLSFRPPFDTMCLALQTSHLQKGETARVLQDVPLFQVLQWGATPIDILPAGTLVHLNEGPRCVPRPEGVLVVWRVRLEDGREGWVPEGLTRSAIIHQYMLASTVRAVPTPAETLYCPDADPSVLQVGMDAYVCTKEDAVFVRQAPGRTHPRLYRAKPGTPLKIIGGPQCSDGWVWWQVRLPNGLEGWMAEGGDLIDPKYICPKR